ncbi:MAG TPA: dihydrolipoamide acetyltransferase family protein [Roseiflexaceae bacterium]|jgi:pyruvate dehydrogenase E2 component (dihydrolipoamide acetyltransferase)
MAEITMPRLSDTMSEGTVGKWLKQPGDKVENGEIIAEIETDKATMELQAFESGTLQKILVPEGQTVPIGQPIALIGDGAAEAEAPAAPPSEGEQAPTEEGAEARTRNTVEADAEAGQSAAQPQPEQPAQGAEQGTEQGDGRPDGERVKASPVARRLAEERGIDLRLVRGTGPGGRIIKENVEDFKPSEAQAAAPTPAQVPTAAPQPRQPAPSPEAVPMSRMRRAIARAMTESKPGTPHIYVTVEIDMAEAMKLRKQINDSGAADIKISVNDLVVKAAAKALLKFPALNSSYATSADGQPAILQRQQVNVSVAVALEDGLVAPVVRDADKKSLGTLAAEIKDLAGRAREGKLKQNELDDATFQVSNLGMYDVVEFTSIIPASQAGSLSVGAVRQVPIVRDGQLAVGEIMNVTLSVDHRVADGATAALYLQELRRLLQSPLSLLV